ncbi:MAG: hypothetical protein JWP71_1319 [Mucilaginibacter sp.]|nr:hypothetical protein [Mucilaginibacter sp.]
MIMNTISLHQYEQLKKRILVTAGISHVLPADCKVLSHRVSKKTGNRISETTFKRIYGFAHSKFTPSLFTLDILAKYCDHKGWKDFCEKEDNSLIKNQNENLNWQLLQQTAHKITAFTLQALKNKSGIPYNQTIKRDFIDFHFDEFLNSGCTGTLLTAPAGYGKTIALCHWIEEKMAADAANGTNDIILLFSSSALMSVLLSGKGLNDWILTLLGYSIDNDINVLLDIKQRKDSKFYLIVDGFDEFMFKNEQFKVTLNQLIDVFSLYQSHDWFKLVLTTRFATWINNSQTMEIGTGTWFTGLENDSYSNVPLFNREELKKLCHKINPAVESVISIEVAESFNHPLYLQFYYKLNKVNFSLNSVDHFSIYELISTFIIHRVFLGNYPTEKLLFIKKFVEALDFENDVYQIDRLQVNDLIKQYSHAYQELLSIGFLRETNESSKYHYNNCIVFGNDNFLEYSIARILLYENSNLFDADLIKRINTLLANSPRKVEVLKWCIMHAINSGQLRNIDQLTEAILGSNEKLELIIFLGKLLEKESLSVKNNEALVQYFKQPFSKKIFEYFFGFELINPDYKKVLNVLLKFEFSTKKKILIHTTLGIIAAIQLDLNELEACLLNLKAFQKTAYDSFIINPLNCLDALYYHLKYGIIKREVLRDLTKLSFNPPTDRTGFKKCASNDLLYLLGLNTMMLCYNSKKTIRFIEFLKKNYKPDLFGDNTTQYGFFLKVITADAYYDLGNNTKVAETYYAISNAYKNSGERLTPYMKILFHNLKVKTLINTPRAIHIVTEMKSINAIADKSGYKFPKLYVSVILLKSADLQTSMPKLYKQVNYDFIKMLHENKLNTKIFLQQNAISNGA